MEVNRYSYSNPPLKKLPVPPEQLPKHHPSIVRDIIEKGAGVINAAQRLPSSILSGAIIGGYHGARKGANAEHEISTKSVAIGIISCSAVVGLAQNAATGYIAAGLPGAIANAAQGSVSTGASLYLFAKGGSSDEMAKEVTGAINSSVKGGEGALPGGLHGGVAGVKSAVKSGSVTGYQEGKGTASGVFEGLKEIPRELSQGEKLKGSFLKRTLSAALGVAGAIISAPAGLALSFFKGPQISIKESSKSYKPVSPVLRKGIAAASGAVIGGLSGLFLGPIGIAAGATLGAAIGLAGPASGRGFEAKLASSLQRATVDNTDLGSNIANHRRDLVEKVITGAVAGVRLGWDGAVQAMGTD